MPRRNRNVPSHKTKTNKQELYRRALREKAEAMQAEYNKLSVEEKIAKLDRLLGEGVGAKRQRARLAKLLESKG